MSSIPVIGVVGTDARSPLYDAQGLWRMWSIHDVYLGEAAQGKHVPKVGDWLVNPQHGEIFEVLTVDAITKVPTYRPRPIAASGGATDLDLLLGPGAERVGTAFRLYVNETTTPFTVQVSAGLYVRGALCRYARLYKGFTRVNAQDVLSKRYNPSGDFISNDVPLEAASIENSTNLTTWCVPSFKVTENLEDGEPVVLVCYSDDGHEVYKTALIVEKTGAFVTSSSGQDFVTSIELVSPYLSPSISGLLEFPVNTPVSALNLEAIVRYSSSRHIKIPVDNNKISLLGIEQYTSNIVDQPLDLVLSYKLASNESYVGTLASTNEHITRPYRMITVQPNKAYSVKLYCYPEWVDNATGYLLRWWMLTLDRNSWHDVTEHVRFNSSTGTYNPKGYGVTQIKQVMLNLRDVSAAYKAHVHVQQVAIMLMNSPNGLNTAWAVNHNSYVGSIAYGNTPITRIQNISMLRVRVHPAAVTQEQWLTDLYRNTVPMYDPGSETAPLVPTHFRVLYKGKEYLRPISDWSEDIDLNDIPENNDSLYVVFEKQVGVKNLVLSIAGMPIYS